jgi:hypothetical protein
MAAAIQHTAPGPPRPGSGSTGAQARRAEPSQSAGLCPHPLRLPPAEHVMARTRVIPAAPLRRSLGSCCSPSSCIPRTPRTPRGSVLLRRHRCLDHLHLPPTRCYICTNTKQTTNKGISVYTSKYVH